MFIVVKKQYIKRIKYCYNLYDIVRIDHFRGFDEYYSIPAGDKDATNGHWEKGPGIDLFNAIKYCLGNVNIIAEDLGYITDSVRQLVNDSGFPNMKVLEFAFDSRDSNNNDYLPHMYPVNCIAYAGTHDNDTIMGWMKTADKEDVKYAKEYLVMGKEEPYWDMIRALWSSVAGTTIIQAQDLLGLGSESRMNIPSTLGGNWSWRAMPKAFNAKIANRLFRLTKLYGRLK